MIIPALQQTSPAGHPDLPYLPLCTQLEARPGGVEGWNAWGPVINKEHQNWHGIPTSWDVTQAYADLEAWGYCTTNSDGIPVPFYVEESAETSTNQGVPAVYTDRIAHSDQVIEDETTSDLPSVYQNRVDVEETTETVASQELPSIYTQRTEQIVQERQSPDGSHLNGIDPAVASATVLAFGAFFAYHKFIRPMALSRQVANDIEVDNISRDRMDVSMLEQEYGPDVSARPSVMPPSAWTYAGSPKTGRFHGEADGETWGEANGEAGKFHREISLDQSETWGEADDFLLRELQKRLNQDKTLDTQEVSPDFTSEADGEAGKFPLDVSNVEAKTAYFRLREEGIYQKKLIGKELFGVTGGKRWDELCELLDTWNSEWETLYAKTFS